VTFCTCSNVDSERREDPITGCTDRFERRLVEEVAGLRLQTGTVDSSIRQDMTVLGASLRQVGLRDFGLNPEVREMRYEIASTLRGLRRDRLTFVATIAAGLGVAAATTIFGAVYAVLLRPLPYPAAGRLVVLTDRHAVKGLEAQRVPPARYVEWPASAHASRSCSWRQPPSCWVRVSSRRTHRPGVPRGWLPPTRFARSEVRAIRCVAY